MYGERREIKYSDPEVERLAKRMRSTFINNSVGVGVNELLSADNAPTHQMDGTSILTQLSRDLRKIMRHTTGN